MSFKIHYFSKYFIIKVHSKLLILIILFFLFFGDFGWTLINFEWQTNLFSISTLKSKILNSKGSAQQGVQDQQQQNIQSSVISSESNNQNTNVNTQQQSKSNFSISFGQQQQQLTQTKSIIMPSTSTFGSNTTGK